MFRGEQAMKNFGRVILCSIFIVFLTMGVTAAWAVDPQSTDPAAANLATPDTQAGDPAAANPATPDTQGANSPAASPQLTDNPAADPPGRVARLEYMGGSVSVQPNGTGDWVQGSANRPLTNGDNIWADKDSRGELNLGTGFLRINSESSLTLTNVNNDAVQVSLHQGALNVHIRHLYKGEVYEIDTPNLAFTVTKNGEYRFDVDPNGDSTLVTVWKGEGEATGQGPAVRVHAGEQARFSGGTSLTHEMHSASKPDGFDEWCRTRDQREDNSISSRYVAPGTVGAEDLDDNGTWTETPDYGNVWVPSAVAPGWTPYSDGNWMWEDPWGWTWNDYAPWGFAPFHYGRWVYWGGAWGWAPGPYWVRPWYAPALVGWFGGPRWGVGFGFGFGFGFGGGFGWCPLGFGEPFYPWFGASRGYFRNVNISNTRITNINRITNNYSNNNFNRYGTQNQLPRYSATASRAISANTLTHGLPVANNSVKVSASQLKGATALSRPNATPTHQAMLGAKASPASARPPASALSRPTVSRMTPPASSRSSAAAADHNNANPARNAASPTAHSAQTPATHTPESSPARNASGATQGRPTGNTATQNHYVPKPPSAGGSTAANGTRPGLSGSSAPRPSNNASAHNVPRPSGPVQPAPHNYSSGESRGGYSGGSSYGRSPYGRSYGGSYGGGSSYSRSYGGRAYSAPSHSSGSYGGSSHGSYGGGGHASGGGSHGGGGGHGGHR
jgi:hypothetical protein